MFKAFGYILSVRVALHGGARTHRTAPAQPVDSFRCCRHTQRHWSRPRGFDVAPRATHTHTRMCAVSWLSRAFSLILLPLRLFISHSTDWRRVKCVPNPLNIWMRAPHQRERVCVGLKNWTIGCTSSVLCSRAHTKWVNGNDVDGSSSVSGDNGKKSNHRILDVNHELTMTSLIKWPPIYTYKSVCVCVWLC